MNRIMLRWYRDLVESTNPRNTAWPNGRSVLACFDQEVAWWVKVMQEVTLLGTQQNTSVDCPIGALDPDTIARSPWR